MTHPKDISIAAYNYDLPEDRIALYPPAQRDGSKLLIYKNGSITDDLFVNIDRFLDKNTLLIFNSTRVVSARLNFLNAKQQPVEIFCLEPGDSRKDPSVAMSQTGAVRWNCLVGNLKRWKEKELRLEKKDVRLVATLVEKKEQFVDVNFTWEPAGLSFAEVLQAVGNLPIPPYLKRADEESDQTRYQTIYAREKGSVAAPTAGLHFTEPVLKKLQERTIVSANVTLHVGAGTFKPVKTEKMEGHEMHAEWMDVERGVIKALLENRPGSIIAVGTTSLRTIETLYWMGVKALQNPLAETENLEIGQWDVYNMPGGDTAMETALGALLSWLEKRKLARLVCKTQIMIAPPYKMRIADGIITNFHQPKSTLLLLVSALTGERWKDIYDYAMAKGFRFLSYGDSSLLLK